MLLQKIVSSIDKSLSIVLVLVSAASIPLPNLTGALFCVLFIPSEQTAHLSLRRETGIGQSPAQQHRQAGAGRQEAN